MNACPIEDLYSVFTIKLLCASALCVNIILSPKISQEEILQLQSFGASNENISLEITRGIGCKSANFMMLNLKNIPFKVLRLHWVCPFTGLLQLDSLLKHLFQPLKAIT